MDPALSILDRALKGDAGSLSFLERTAAIYVYDGTNPGQPKTCGAWDFLNQALTEVERYERNGFGGGRGAMNVAATTNVNLEPHVQLLATMSKRAARRCPVSDQNLVQVCLNNAAQFHGSTEHAKHLIDFNKQMRDRVMGRIAAITFDFANHPKNMGGGSHFSVFSNPIAMDSLCAVVAANAISTGPHEFTSLVEGWIVPSINNLPPLSVAAIIYHLASEAMGKNAPIGTHDALRKLFDSVISKVLAPMFQEAVRDSDSDNGSDSASMVGGRARSHRMAAITLKGMDRWCAATNCSISRLKKVCQTANIQIIGSISDALYSDSEVVIDALSDLLDTLLRQNAVDQNALDGLAMAEKFLKEKSASAFGNSAAMDKVEDSMRAETKDRDHILAELVSAVGMQRFRFSSRLSSGDSGVCRCLTSIARSVAVSSQALLRSGALQGAERGMIDLLMKGTSHSSINVYSIALDALTFFMTPNSDISTRLLPVLQGKAIVPPSIVGIPSDDDIDIDLHEFERFREHQLSDILTKCYINCRSYYIESCCMAIEEFCSGAPNAHTPFQMEAALFCLCAVSVDASKRALLLNASPAAQLAAAKASNSQHLGLATQSLDAQSIASDAKHHDEKMSRCILAIAKSSSTSLKNPLFLSQLCRLLGKYANWLSKTPSEGVLDAAAHLALTSFNESTSTFGQQNEIIGEMTVSPFTEAAAALRNILSRAPTRFANAEALSALENGWRSIYNSNLDANAAVTIDDRRALCTGITRVLAVLPIEQWTPSLASLANPTINCIETLVRDASQSPSIIEKARFELIISRLGVEICVLAIALRTFNNFAKKNSTDGQEQVKAAILPPLHRVWPCINLIAKNFSGYEVVVSSLSEFLLIVVSLNDDGKDLSLITEACGIAVAIMDGSAKKMNQQSSLPPILEFVQETVNIFGHQAEVHANGGFTTTTNVLTENMHKIIQNLVQKSFHAVQAPIQGGNAIEDVLPGIFAICRSCIRRCPVLLMNLNAGDGDVTHGAFAVTTKAAMSSIDNRQTEIVRSALLYLDDAFSLATPASHTTEAVTSMALKHVNTIREDLISALITGACGMFPREVLDPAGNLLHSILKSTEARDAERICTLVLQKDSFRLGTNARHSVLLTLGRGTQGSIAPSVFMDLFDDLWAMHQNDDTGGNIAGGDAISLFSKKYGGSN